MLAGRVEGMTNGPHAVVRVAGKVYFVRGGSPGDEVEIEEREDRGRFAFAEITRLIAAGPARREAPCPYLPACGGCPWQHLTTSAQAEAKERNLRDLLGRIGGLTGSPVLPLLRPSPDLGYRRRLSLRVEDRRVGYLAGGTHELVPVDECLLAAPELRGAIPLAEAWVGRLRSRVNRIEIASLGPAATESANGAGAGEGKVVLVAQFDGALDGSDLTTSDALLRATPRLAALVLRGRGFRHALGDDTVRVSIEPGLELALHAGDFTQVSDVGNEILVRTVLEMGAPTAQDIVLDLYAGAGNFALPLARRAGRVLAIERSRAAATSARESAQRHGLGGLEVITGDVGRALRERATMARLRGVSLVVLDPPRSGAAEAIEPLLRLGAARIVYVSCDPATLARDLRSLSGHYRVLRVQPIDLFPQTYHLESVTLLERSDGGEAEGEGGAG